MRPAPWHYILLAIVVLVLFGAGKLPGFARSLGQSLRIFKAEAKAMKNDDDLPVATPQAQITAMTQMPAAPAAAQPVAQPVVAPVVAPVAAPVVQPVPPATVQPLDQTLVQPVVEPVQPAVAPETSATPRADG